MGEYATRASDGAQIKIGTCEDMYYLRADQRFAVEPQNGSLDPARDSVARMLRFRFPWPDEDHILPGGNEFHDNGYHRAVTVDAKIEGFAHHTVQFASPVGYVTSLPCPEGPDTPKGVTIHRNGFAGAVQLVAQKLLTDGRLVPVVRCGGCHAMVRIEEPAQIECIAVAFRCEGDRREHLGERNGTGKVDRTFWDSIADRLLRGAKISHTD